MALDANNSVFSKTNKRICVELSINDKLPKSCVIDGHTQDIFYENLNVLQSAFSLPMTPSSLPPLLPTPSF